jgi:hypothetical protein
MRCAFLLLCSAPLFAQTFLDWGTRIRLSDGAQSLRVYDALEGTPSAENAVLTLPLNGAAYQMLTFWPSVYTAGAGSLACDTPCAVAMNLHDGTIRAYVERFDGNGNLLSAGTIAVPQLGVSTRRSFAMPLEVIGHAPYRVRVAKSVQDNANLSGAERLYVVCHRCNYEGKARVRINDGDWIDIKRSNVTLLDAPRAWNAGSLHFGQSVLYLAISLPEGLTHSGENIFEFEYYRLNYQEENGYRVLAFNVLEEAKAVTATSISGSTVELNVAAHGYATGDDILIDNFPGAAWRVNRVKRNITVTGPNSFTFTIPEGDGKRNGTWTYPGVTVSRMMIDADSFSDEDPSSWTAPSGGNASEGAAAWNQSPLKAPFFLPQQSITASCAKCHAHDGRDLQYFNYSNRSIRVRAEMHGLTDAQSRDLATYIRSHPTSRPGRPWTFLYQGCPNADVVDPQDWSAACGLDDVLPHEGGMYDQIFGDAPDPGDFDPDRADLHFRNMRTSLQLLDWNDWLPRIHPQDRWNSALNLSSYPKGYWATSDLLAGYNEVRANYGAPNRCPGTGTQCRDYITNLDDKSAGFFKMLSQRLTGWRSYTSPEPPECAGNPPNSTCPSSIATLENNVTVGNYSAGLWSATKIWELMHEFDLERHGLAYFPRGGSDNQRVIPSNQFFNSSPNLSKSVIPPARLITGIVDGSTFAEQVINFQWYQLQANVMSTGNRCCPASFDSINPLDVPYQWGIFISGAGPAFNLLFPMLSTAWTQQMFNRYRNTKPDDGDAKMWYPSAINPVIGIGTQAARGWLSIAPSDRMPWKSAIQNAMTEKWLDLACGVARNGSAPLFTTAMWQNYAQNGKNNRFSLPDLFSIGQPGELADFWWGLLIVGKAHGLSPALLDRVQTCGQAIFTGPSASLAAGINSSQTTLTISSDSAWGREPFGPFGSVQVQIGSEKITCLNRSGATLSSCTRGADSTAPAAHLAGQTVQRIIRWNAARNSNCALIDGWQIDGSGGCMAVWP